MPRLSVIRLAVLALLLVSLFSLVTTKGSVAQTQVRGSVYVYRTMSDTTTELINSGKMKFFSINSNGQSAFIGECNVQTDGSYTVTLPSNLNFYGVIYPNDLQDNSFVTTFWPGWLDFESTDILRAAPGEVIEYDFGAVGQEIVERPSATPTNVSGRILLNNAAPLLSAPQVYIFQGENVVATIPVNTDGTYSAEVYVSGEFEIFVSAAGYASASRFTSTTSNTKGDYDFNLEVFRFEDAPSLASTTDTYSLSQNYPNPFNPSTNIAYVIPVAGLVKVSVYDVSGKEVANLVNTFKEIGSYSVQFNASTLSSGMYFYKLSVGDFTITKRMMLVK